jgi:hypothetical protein
MATRQFRASVITLIVVFLVTASLAGFLAARLLQQAVEEASGSASTSASPSGGHVPTRGAITPNGAVLRPANGEFSPLGPSTACASLFHPGWKGACGVEQMAGSWTAWVSESRAQPDLATAAHQLRILTYDEGRSGWVEQLHATDIGKPPWVGLTVVPRDLTGDGKPELVVGYRYSGSGGDLGIDIVANDDGVPVVEAHPDDAVHGSAVFQGRNLIQYLAHFALGEANCCPSTFTRRTIAYLDRDFRVVDVREVAPSEVPPSEL